MLDDFIFRGRDISDLGACAALGDQTTGGTQIARSAYELPGGAALCVGPDSYKAITRSIIITPADGVDGGPGWGRRIINFLQGPPGRLTFKHSPEVYRMARFDAPPVYGFNKWPDGYVEAKMTVTGLCHAARLHTAETDAQSGAEVSLSVDFDTALPSPVRLSVLCTDGKITGMTAGDLEVSRLALTPGETLCYDSGDAHQERLASLTVGEMPALGSVDRWARLALRSRQTLPIRLIGGSGHVILTLQGRFYG